MDFTDECTTHLQTTLVKYEPPEYVTCIDTTKFPCFKILHPEALRQPCSGFPENPCIPGLIRTSKTSQDKSFNQEELEQILNSIFPPIEFEENGKLWRKIISSKPATRSDVLVLKENLLMKFQQQQARENGICPVRRELFAQVFDELIRQVTINNAERGLILVRIRDEMRTVLCTLGEIFDSGKNFGLKKADLAIEDVDELQSRYDEMVARKADLQEQVYRVEEQIYQNERKFADILEVEERKHYEDLLYIKRANEQFKFQLDEIIGIFVGKFRS